MRLIKEDDVMKIIDEELKLRCGYDSDIALLSVKKQIAKLPTAYDVEKVVEEIKGQFGCKDCEYVDEFQHPACSGCAELEVVNDIIDIVRRGGVPNEN